MASEKVGPKGGEPVVPTHELELGSDVEKSALEGLKGEGTPWTIGFNRGGLEKLVVNPTLHGIRSVKKFSELTQEELDDKSESGDYLDLDMKADKDYLVSVEGWYNNSSNIITNLTFKTNNHPDGKPPIVLGRTFQDGKDTKFTLKSQGKKIIGFYGFSRIPVNSNIKKPHIMSIGAYFVPIDPPPPPPETGSALEKSALHGGEGGTRWTVEYNRGGLASLHIASTGYGIKFVKESSHVKKDLLEGKRTCGPILELDLKDPQEYVVSVEGWYDTPDPESEDLDIRSKIIIQGIIFKTNKASFRIGSKFHPTTDTKFTLRSQGKKIIGFYGFGKDPVGSPSGNEHIVSIGAYFIPIVTTPPPPEIMLQGYGGDGAWDDGLFDGVKKVFVGQGSDGIAAVKFVYHKEGKDEEIVHGEPMMGYEKPFELDYPSEYITEVDGYYDKIYGHAFEVINMLRFTTNKGRKSIPFGLQAGIPFTLKKEGYKIVGFHGVAGNMLHKIGVHVLPIPTPIITK